MAAGGTVWNYSNNAACGSEVGKMGTGFAGPIDSDSTNKCFSRGRSLSEIPTPADTISLTEMPDANNAMTFRNHAVILRPSTSGAKTSCATGVTSTSGTCGQDFGVDDGIHFNGFNYLFADGHVKWLRPEGTKGTGTVYAPRGMWTIAEGD